MPDTDLLDLCNVLKMRSFLLSIKELDNLYLYPTGQDSDFINVYKISSPEVQEMWDVRVS
ncbi:hypothetical protein A1E_02095 [Rickettsia canadensis str. McKiel]|uniref:Uncharacterized protein n=1 Tax=Rickettsia canadensis (strain McKiel) TaxID=293613 RepID=A8EYD1_RICCK|nr:hypothetical protein [Rickettsia canadensis]ABV73364.1 hypothetical protein A1E_02095 [Rickettsia canadensis str. McKiel]